MKKDFIDYSQVSEPEKRAKRQRGMHIALVAVITVFVVVVIFSSFYTVNVNETAILTTFGSPQSITATGIHGKIPFIQQVHKVSREIQGLEVGYDSSSDDSTVAADAEMITADYNFVDVDFFIEYQVVDPLQYYINRNSADQILTLLAKSYIRDTVGVYNVDDVITTDRPKIQSEVKQKLSERMEAEDVGLGIVNVTIQDAEPPTTDVSTAFKAVEDAKQAMDTEINKAKKYQSEQIPAANAAADKAAQDAEAYKQQRINEATGQASRFNDMYEEYKKYPLITKKRMFYETMEDVLPDLKVIINEGNGTQTMLPLDSFSTVSGN